jgi:hypothetical protein
MFLHDDKWHDPNVATWVYRLMNDPEYYEQFRYKDTINNYNMLLGEFEKRYEQTPVTQRLTRATIRSAIKRAERELVKALAEYDKFKAFKARTSISK